MEGAKIYAQNAIRKKNEQLNYMKLASRLDAVVSRLETQAKMQMVTKSFAGIVKSLEGAMASNSLEKIAGEHAWSHLGRACFNSTVSVSCAPLLWGYGTCMPATTHAGEHALIMRSLCALALFIQPCVLIILIAGSACSGTRVV